MKRVMMSFELPKTMFNKIAKTAKAQGISKSDVVRFALKEYLSILDLAKKGGDTNAQTE